VVEDKLLIWKLNRGSRDALCQIYEKYRDDLLRIAAGLLNETDSAEDIVHDVFVAFIRSARQFQLTGSLRGYLTTCVANKARNLNRTKTTQRTVNLDEIEPRASNLKRPEQWIIDNEQFRRVNNALSQLSYEQREVIILHLQGGMKFKAIAELQGVSINTVQSRYRYGLDKLRSILDSEAEL